MYSRLFLLALVAACCVVALGAKTPSSKRWSGDEPEFAEDGAVHREKSSSPNKRAGEDIQDMVDMLRSKVERIIRLRFQSLKALQYGNEHKSKKTEYFVKCRAVTKDNTVYRVYMLINKMRNGRLDLGGIRYEIPEEYQTPAPPKYPDYNEDDM